MTKSNCLKGGNIQKNRKINFKAKIHTLMSKTESQKLINVIYREYDQKLVCDIKKILDITDINNKSAIKAAYKKRSVLLHEDKLIGLNLNLYGKEPKHFFQVLNAAYKIAIDNDLMSQYNLKAECPNEKLNIFSFKKKELPESSSSNVPNPNHTYSYDNDNDFFDFFFRYNSNNHSTGHTNYRQTEDVYEDVDFFYFIVSYICLIIFVLMIIRKWLYERNQSVDTPQEQGNDESHM